MLCTHGVGSPTITRIHAEHFFINRSVSIAKKWLWKQQKELLRERNVIYNCIANVLKCYIPVCPCSINAEHEEQARMTNALGKITAALSPIQEEYRGHIPKSVISDAMKKLGLEECAKGWLSKQGWYISTTPDTWFKMIYLHDVCMTHMCACKWRSRGIKLYLAMHFGICIYHWGSWLYWDPTHKHIWLPSSMECQWQLSMPSVVAAEW